MGKLTVCVGKSPDALWTDGTGIARCGRTDNHGGHVVAKVIADGVEQAKRHGHPSWSHVVAGGPCTRTD